MIKEQFPSKTTKRSKKKRIQRIFLLRNLKNFITTFIFEELRISKYRFGTWWSLRHFPKRLSWPLQVFSFSLLGMLIKRLKKCHLEIKEGKLMERERERSLEPNKTTSGDCVFTRHQIVVDLLYPWEAGGAVCGQRKGR